MNREKNHPVWTVYDLLRTSELNVCYYSKRLCLAQNLHVGIQIFLAATVSTSAIASLEIWTMGLGEVFWNILLSLSGVVAFFHPFMKLQKKIEIYSAVVEGYKNLRFDLEIMKHDIETQKEYNKSHIDACKKAFLRRKQLEQKQTGLKDNKRLKNKCVQEVYERYPTECFFVPS